VERGFSTPFVKRLTSTLKFITIELKKTTKNVVNQIKFYARNNEHEQLYI
jgi:hypothetical protein